MKKRKESAVNNRVPLYILNTIKKYSHFLIVSHINPEGDSIGSQLALRELLLAQGKKVHILNSDKVPGNYHFIPNWKVIEKTLNNFFYEAIFVLDCSDFSRIGKIKEKIDKKRIIVNIDHHTTNKNFGDINWVDKNASCVSEMIYRIYKSLSLGLNRDIAFSLYAGLVSDTGSFRYSNTNYKTLAIASELVKFKLPVYHIYRHIFGGISFSDINLLLNILTTLKYDRSKRICWLRLERGLLKGKGIESDISDLVFSLVRLIKGVRVVVLFKESPDRKDEVRVNFRSNDDTDVGKVAQFFGGGGHKTASGCTLKGNIEEVEKNVLERIKWTVSY